MQSLYPHLCLVIVMILQKSYCITKYLQLKLILSYSHQIVRIVVPVSGILEKGVLIALSRHLTDVPQNLFSNIRRLDLSYNQITLLRNTSFLAYLQLVELEFSGNQIYYIEMGTFYPLVYIEFLSLFGNPVHNLNGDMFQWMCELQHLVLVFTNLSSFSVRIKNRAHKLQRDDMELSGHYKDKISQPNADEMNKIILSKNHITRLSAENLVIESECIPISLDLEMIQFEIIDPDGIASLHVTAVQFGWNKLSFEMIRNITLGVSRSDVIQILSLENANLANVPHDLFDFLRNKSLFVLDLRKNDLLLYPSVFAALTHVSILDISYCNLKTLDPRYFHGWIT